MGLLSTLITSLILALFVAASGATDTAATPRMGAVRLNAPQSLPGLPARSLTVRGDGAVEVHDAKGAMLSRLPALEAGCAVDGVVAAWGSDGAFALFAPWECVVEGGTLVIVGREGRVQLLDRIPFNFKAPVSVPRGVVAAAEGFAGRLDLPSQAWSWQRRDVVSPGPGGGTVTPSNLSIEGPCVVVSEDAVAAAQYRRSPEIVFLSLRDGRSLARGDCR